MTDASQEQPRPGSKAQAAIPGFALDRAKLENAADKVLADFPQLPRDDLLALLANLRLMPNFDRSVPRFEDGLWSVPKDLPPWKETRARLSRLLNKLQGAEVLMRSAVHEDPSLLEALRAVDSAESLDQRYADLLDLTEMCERAMKISGSAGNRPLPAWTAKAAELCIGFWKAHGNGPATASFHGDGASQPANTFSTWFCRILKLIDGKMTVSQCETILRVNRRQKKAD